MTHAPRQRIAVIGSGIAGLASAYLLARRHQVTLFEAADYLGGHTHTVDIDVAGQALAVDTGFLVFNERTYPNLIALFAELGINSHPTSMSFSVSLEQGREEWAGMNLDSLFAQRRKLLSPSFWGMLHDILRFNRSAPMLLQQLATHPLSLGELLQQQGYGARFREHYLLPMAAAIWSSPSGEILHFPAASFLQFCQNHGLLQLRERPQWRSIPGGARQYVDKIAATLDDIRLNQPVQQLSRHADGVLIRSAQGDEHFDAVICATHAPQTLQMLADATTQERAILGAVRYQPNRAVLHSDPRLLPRRRKTWAAWNFLGEQPAVSVSYWLNLLQALPLTEPVILTLNPLAAADPARQYGQFDYAHPLLDQAAIDAQQALAQIQGQGRCWFAGAWTGYGFHEDGLKSALRIAAAFDLLPDWAQI
ncbi:FAD-dependent oxidoreductase [Neisseriaceae bacterium TC5R-5]|nr:FAD-dependent oxidoreductase [Neisseriaceae bacterium TC5R-5]